ncbi:MAG: copper amine oxidase N-terminal domain-containing protein [Bacillota bacterium]|jgi:hypothetical protein
MKKFILFLLTFVFAMGMVLPASADATYPVYQEDNWETPIAEGRSINGSVYLPLRSLFETFDASVYWDSKEKSVRIRRCDDAVLQIFTQGGKKSCLTLHNGKKTEISTDKKIYVINGTTWVPLRFIGENMLCTVRWDNQYKSVFIDKNYAIEKDVSRNLSYILNLQNGELYEKNQDSVKYIGLCSKTAEFLNTYSSRYSGLNVERTENGNYLICVDILSTGALTSTAQEWVWANGQTGESISALTHGLGTPTVSDTDGSFSSYTPVQKSGDIIWLGGNNILYKINDRTETKEKVFDLSTLIKPVASEQSEDIYFINTAGKNLLLENSSGCWYLVDTAGKQPVNLCKELLTEQLKADVNEFLMQQPFYRNQDDLNYYWQSFGKSPYLSVDPVPSMQLRTIQSDVLHFDFICSYYNADGSWGKKIYPLTYQYK